MKKTIFSLLTTFALTAISHAADSGGKSLVLKTKDGLAIQGYDPVAYFTDNKPMKGNPKFNTEYDGAKYLFASSAHKEMFDANPTKYARLTAGIAVIAASIDRLSPVAPEWFQIEDGKLILQHNKKAFDLFNKELAPNVQKADANWPGLVARFSSADQFRQWVSLGPDGPDLVAELPGGSASASATIFAGLDVLGRHGYLDADFYARLIAAYPRRSDDIRRVATSNSAAANTTTHGGIHIGNVGGNVHMQAGRDIVAGDQHTTIHAAPTLPEVHHALEALRVALGELGGADHKKIAPALAEAADELARPNPDRDDVRDAVDRALKVAARVAPDITTRPAVAAPLATLRAWTGA